MSRVDLLVPPAHVYAAGVVDAARGKDAKSHGCSLAERRKSAWGAVLMLAGGRGGGDVGLWLEAKKTNNNDLEAGLGEMMNVRVQVYLQVALRPARMRKGTTGTQNSMYV